VRAGNEFSKTIGTKDLSCDIICDYSKFTVVNVSRSLLQSIKPKEQICNVEPGITIDELNGTILKEHG
jgi:hypothetical protein